MKKVRFQGRRLQVLADTLRIVPRKRFNIGTWLTGKFCNVTKPIEANHDEHECGSSACAFGWACTIPSFQRAGLSMKKKNSGCGPYFVPAFKRSTGFSAATRFFGVTDNEATFMFAAENPNGSKKAARRIEKVIRYRAMGKELPKPSFLW